MSDVMDNFPNGLMRAGSVRDEINLNTQIATSYVERLDYNPSNIAIAEQSGREYETDRDYIYIAKAEPETFSFSLDGSYSVSDHGIEFFTGTTVPVETEILYGQNLKDKLRTDVPTLSQPLNAEQQVQFLANIGAQAEMVFSDITSSAWTWGHVYVTGDSPSASFLALGRLRMLRFTITPKSTQTSWTTIGTVAEGHRPLQYVSVFAIESNSTPTPKHIRLKPDGTCEMYARGTVTYSANLMWFV